MDILSWIAWLLLKILGIAWGLVWFLLGGWVATLAQIGVVALVIFGYKYGWRQAPQELLSRTSRLVHFAWGWVRARELRAASSRPEVVRHAAQRTPRAPGDVNLSTLLNVLMLMGLAAAALI